MKENNSSEEMKGEHKKDDLKDNEGNIEEFISSKTHSKKELTQIDDKGMSTFRQQQTYRDLIEIFVLIHILIIYCLIKNSQIWLIIQVRRMRNINVH